MENFRLSRTTYQLIKRAVEALERISRELERYNDRHERTAEKVQTGRVPTNHDRQSNTRRLQDREPV